MITFKEAWEREVEQQRKDYYDRIGDHPSSSPPLRPNTRPPTIPRPVTTQAWPELSGMSSIFAKECYEREVKAQREVEDVLYQHQAVREAAVVGVPDTYRGETVVAYVALKSGFEERVTTGELIEICKQRMANYKYPRHIEIMDDLPKTPTGKFLRRELRDMARQ